MRLIILLFACIQALSSIAQSGAPDVVIKNATVFSSRTGALSKNQTILIRSGVIINVSGKKASYPSTQTIDAAGKLVTPGFIDTHIHPTDVFRSYGPLPETLPTDSLALFRKRISETFLPYGVTTAMIMGHSEKWLQPILNWVNDPQPDLLNLYTVGGAFVSDDNRKPYINHVVVGSPLAAKEKVLAYYNQGLRHIKLYWKLRRPEFSAAYHTADSLGMKVYGHVDQNVMFIDSALDIGLKNYEHALTLVNSVFRVQIDGQVFNAGMQKNYPPGSSGGQLERLEMFRFIHDQKPAILEALITRLAKNKATLSTSIHLMAEPFGLTYFTTKLDTSLSPVQLARCKENFTLFMGYIRQAYLRGVTLRIGTDWPSGGKAIISEQLLLSEHGFTVPEILQISTLNGARALGLDDKYGSIEKGRHADLLIWDQSPFDDSKNFQSGRTIIKDGVVLKKSL